MLVRLFFIVLTLTGSVPARLCTCPMVGAAHTEVNDLRNHEHSSGQSCSCNHRLVVSFEPVCVVEPCTFAILTESSAESHPVPDRHHDNCPVLYPRTMDSSVVTSPVVVGPDDPGICEFVRFEATTLFTVASLNLHRPVGMDVPLYLSLRSLRI